MFKDLSNVEKLRERMRQNVHPANGSDTTGIELVGLTHLVARTYDMISTHNQEPSSAAISRARWGVLMRLWREEKEGVVVGLTPTYLSKCQNVGKNTVSALLRGLEEQGLVQRALDPVDHRIFRIQLTPAGREMISAHAPRMLGYLNRLASGLSEAERVQLCDLLEKLYYSILAETKIPAAEVESTYYKDGG